MTRDLCYKRINETRANLTDWFDEIDKGLLPHPEQKIGWLKIAFTYSFYYLKHSNDIFKS
jgi:hypothetical protein